MDLPELNHRNISDEVYDILRAKIISCEFPPGQQLILESIEKQLNVSRTPVKDALRRLSVEGLVEIVPRKGTFVSNLSKEEIAEAFDVRRVLEMYATELAIPRMKEEHLTHMRAMVAELRRMVQSKDWNNIFSKYVDLDHNLHRYILELAGNGKLLWVHNHVNVHVVMARVGYGRSEREVAVAHQQEHEEILKSFEARDVRGAVAAVDRHIERAKISLLQAMTEVETNSTTDLSL
jgi:DNA-binding GntR family transcriptional regulator